LSKNNQKKILCLFLFLLMGGGCTSFQQLTTYHEDQQTGPKAADCGSCHLLQFQEWSNSAHAHSFQNVSFQESFHDGGGEECLACHATLEIRQGNTEPRSFNQEEGVTCISCHLSEGKMHGPHPASALLHPHPVVAEDDFYLRVELCASCHSETYDEYQRLAKRQEVPSCLACHAAPRQRTASQGTNFFSRALVSFEEEVATRSHDISLAAMPPESALLPLVLHALHHTAEGATGEINITNNLAHNLPTGTFGSKKIRMELRFVQGDKVLAEATRLISDEQTALMPGETRRLAFSITGPVASADGLQISLVRHPGAEAARPAVLLTTTTFSLAGKKMR
jgi:hypothetical protein